MTKEIVKTVGLTKRYSDVDVVKDLELSVKEGSIYGFLGPNGAGKSTTLKMLLGLARPTAGKICLFCQPFTERSRIRLLSQVGSLIESPSYYGHLTAKENLKIYTTIQSLPEHHIDEVLQIVGLDGQKNKRTAAFSLGMKQRLGLASALIAFPRLLILDEPTNGLDPAGIQEMRELIRSLPQRYGMTVVISSHLLSEIDQLADDIGIIARGQLRYQGALAELHRQAEGRSLEEIFLTLTGGGLGL